MRKKSLENQSIFNKLDRVLWELQTLSQLKYQDLVIFGTIKSDCQTLFFDYLLIYKCFTCFFATTLLQFVDW